ncbi:MAG: hypothetical protein KAJ31_08840 [Deltaproteobacteria bacterium]|nr:hypothetical protein [Deltaproteobacteria bacterium]MCK5709880.1 hypothetical protein [Deltaproteobacteria bacterium]
MTVPWFFSDFDEAIILGFPAWALYSFLMTVLYAVIIAVLIARYWSVSADDENDNEGEQ